MERLTGMDAAFFHMETPDMHMHVMGTIIVDPSTMPGGYSFDTIKRTVAGRIPTQPDPPSPTCVRRAPVHRDRSPSPPRGGSPM